MDAPQKFHDDFLLVVADQLGSALFFCLSVIFMELALCFPLFSKKPCAVISPRPGVRIAHVRQIRQYPPRFIPTLYGCVEFSLQPRSWDK